MFFSITTYNFLTTDSKLQHVPSIFSLIVFTSLWSLHSYAARRSYKNHVKEVSGNFKDPVRVCLAVLKKNGYFSRFQNSSINLFGITSEESWFLSSKIMLLNDVYMGQKIQRTLKLSMSFSLKHVLSQ